MELLYEGPSCLSGALDTISIGEVLSLKDNNHDNYCVAVMKGYTVVGHVPDQPAMSASTFWAEMATGGSVELQEAI